MSSSEPGATAMSDGPAGYREQSSGQYGESQGAKEQAQEKVQEAAGQAKEQAQQAAGQASDRARALVDERSTEAGRQVTQQASDLRSVSRSLREQGSEGPAKIADQAADRAERLGTYLEQSDADRILSDLEDFGRRRPWAVALGGLAVGFAASRFLKASSTQRYQQRSRPPVPALSPATAAGVGTRPGNGGAPADPLGRGRPTPPASPSPITPRGRGF
jgi:hypothetical protein